MTPISPNGPSKTRSFAIAGVLVAATATVALAVAGVSTWFVATANDEYVENVAASRKIAVAEADGLVFATNVKTGEVLWSDTPNFVGGEPHDIAVHKKLAVVAGDEDTGTEIDGRVIAYDLKTGDYLWNISIGQLSGDDEIIVDVIASGKFVFVTGRVTNVDGDHAYIAAINTKNGVIEWDDMSEVGTRFQDLDAKGKVIAAVGEVGVGDLGYVAIFEAKTGNVYAKETYLHDDVDFDRFDHVAASRKFVVAGGDSYTVDTDTLKALTVVFDLDGNVVWDDAFALVGGDSYMGDVGVAGKTVVSGGSFFPDFTVPDSTGFVRGFDSKTGELLWTVERELGGSFDEVDDIVTRGKLVIGCGERLNPIDLEFTDVFAIDAKTGDVQWTAEAIAEDFNGDCDEAALAGKTVVFNADGDDELLRAVSTK